MSAAELSAWVDLLEEAERRLLATLEEIPEEPRKRSAEQDRKYLYARADLAVLHHGAPVGIQGGGSILDVLENAGVDVSSAPSVRLPLAMARRRLEELAA